jgi:hypothetical protein
MAIQQEEKRIGDCTYRVTMLDAVEGSRTFIRLSRTFGPALSKIDLSTDTSIGQVVGSLCERLTEEDFEHYCKLFMKKTSVELEDGKEPMLKDIFEVHFAGKYLEMVQWLAFCFEVNFRGFFDGAGSFLRKAMQPAPVPVSKSPSTSTGSSGDS